MGHLSVTFTSTKTQYHEHNSRVQPLLEVNPAKNKNIFLTKVVPTNKRWVRWLICYYVWGNTACDHYYYWSHVKHRPCLRWALSTGPQRPLSALGANSGLSACVGPSHSADSSSAIFDCKHPADFKRTAVSGRKATGAILAVLMSTTGDNSLGGFT